MLRLHGSSWVAMSHLACTCTVGRWWRNMWWQLMATVWWPSLRPLFVETCQWLCSLVEDIASSFLELIFGCKLVIWSPSDIRSLRCSISGRFRCWSTLPIIALEFVSLVIDAKVYNSCFVHQILLLLWCVCPLIHLVALDLVLIQRPVISIPFDPNKLTPLYLETNVSRHVRWLDTSISR
jgi:hypothetical protein